MNFTLEEYKDYELTTSRINTSVNNIVGLSATKELGAQEDLDTFGLTDEALCTITVHYKDGGEDQLVLGAEAGESSGNYILKDGEVYIGYLPSQLYYGPFTYFDNEVYAVADRVSETGDEEGTTSQETLSDQLNSMELSGTHFPPAHQDCIRRHQDQRLPGHRAGDRRVRHHPPSATWSPPSRA